MALTPIFTDLETYWDKDYTLSKLSPIEYCYGDQFEAQSAATKVGLTGETIVTFGFDETKALFDDIGRTVGWDNAWLIGHNCVTPDHEVLTPTGWVRFDSLTGDELIAQWDHATGAAQFVPFKLVKHAYVGTMLRYDSSFHKGVYTPDHRAYWRHNKTAPWRVTTVDVMASQSPNRPYVPASATRLVGFQTTELSVDEARLLEAFRADGCWTQKGSMQFGFKKLRKVSRLTLLLDVLGLRYSYKVRAGVHCFSVSKGQPPVERVRGLVGSSKSFGPALLTIPPEAQRAIVEETKYWDGSDWGGKTSHVLTTCDEATAEWLQILAVLNGHGFKYSTKPMSGNWAKPGSTVHQGMVRARAQVKTLYAPEEIQYIGDVYCVQVPSQAFFVRREGAAWVTGNCSEFDSLILAGNGRDHFGLKPAMWGCTLAMARPIHAKTVGGSLKALAEHYGLQAKGSLEATNTRGLRLADFTPEMRAAMVEYNKIDTEICAALFKALLKQTPADELRLIDMTIKMLVHPRLEANIPMLQMGLKAETRRKEKQLERLSDKLGVAHDAEEVRKTCASAPKFKALLAGLGVEVPMKTSPTTGREIPALAKTDKAMTELLEHPDEVVQAAAEARLGVRSTLLETRIGRMITAAEAFGGMMPIPLRYYGADTTGRFSGTMSMNLQNLPRVNPKHLQISDVLRRSLRAPEGHQVVVADLSGIEMRVNHFLWQEPESMALFKADRKADLYRALGPEVYNIAPEAVTKAQRQYLKIIQLGCGYGAGAKTFREVARVMGGLTISQEDAENAVRGWRAKYNQIVAGWKRCDRALEAIHDKEMMEIDPWGLCVATPQGIKTPRGAIRYPGLHREDDPEPGRRGSNWVYGSGRNRRKVYSGLVDENLVQHLARHVMTDAMLAYTLSGLGKRYPISHTVHDEVIIVARTEDAQDTLDQLQECLRTPPTWWPELVTYSEGGYAPDYGLVEK